jgi:esterase/lipase superfamily enzyme
MIKTPLQPLVARLLGLVVLGGLMGGCMPTFDRVTSDFASPTAIWRSQLSDPHDIRILVASTRKVNGKGQMTGEIGAETSFYATSVSIPPGHRAGVIERPSITSESKARHVVLGPQRNLDGEGFRTALATSLSGRVGVARDVLIFVHGFNTSYDEARFRLAQVVEDAQFSGVPVLFTWPSKSDLFAYVGDKDSATASRDSLERLLREVAATPGVGRVHVLAHSMGTWLAMEALRQNAIAGQADLGGRLGEVMLASPDIGLDVFRGQMARLGSVTRVSVFAASDDKALSLSGALAGSRTRVGALDLNNADHRAEIARLGVRVYDLSKMNVQDVFRHGNYAEAPQIVGMIGAQLAEPKVEDRQASGFVDDDALKAAKAPPPGVAPVTTENLPPPPQ